MDRGVKMIYSFTNKLYSAQIIVLEYLFALTSARVISLINSTELVDGKEMYNAAAATMARLFVT